MTMIANATTEISVIDSLAMQARTLRISINANMWALARVFIEAKEIVPRGEWGAWLEENADVSVRTAEDMMAAYRRFGERPEFAALGQAKTFRLLPLPKESEEKFFKEHDLDAMTAREVQEAVKNAREEARAEIEREKAARIDAERRAAEAENRGQEIPEEVAQALRDSRETIERQKAEVERLSEIGEDALTEQRRLTQENAALQREIVERDAMLQEQQDALNRAQDELLSMQSEKARGESGREEEDGMTLDALRAAVRAFMGTCGGMPYMRSAFAVMDEDIKRGWRECLLTLEGWCGGTRKALDAVAAEGGGVR